MEEGSREENDRLKNNIIRELVQLLEKVEEEADQASTQHKDPAARGRVREDEPDPKVKRAATASTGVAVISLLFVAWLALVPHVLPRKTAAPGGSEPPPAARPAAVGVGGSPHPG